MTSVRKSLELPYRPQDMYELISDVKRYPEFVRWLQSLRVTQEETTAEGWRGRAEASVGFAAFLEHFTTDIEGKRPAEGKPGQVKVSLVRGPFRKLRNLWVITPQGQGSRVDFEIDFEFRNFILQALASANLDLAVRKLIEAFELEAAKRYAPVGAAQLS